MLTKPNRMYHAGLDKYGDIIELSNEWVTARIDGEKGTGCWEVNAPYIKIFIQEENPKPEPIDPDAATFEVTITKEEDDLMRKLWLKPEPLTENVTKEYRELEVAIYDLKTENNRLLRDKERLEWLMSMVGWASTREDIDRMRNHETDE